MDLVTIEGFLVKNFMATFLLKSLRTKKQLAMTTPYSEGPRTQKKNLKKFLSFLFALIFVQDLSKSVGYSQISSVLLFFVIFDILSDRYSVRV